MTEIATCAICGEPMPQGEEMFRFHGYSGSCPKPPLLQPHQQRVVDEKAELDTKAKALSAFIGTSPIFDTLSPDEQDRLKEQNDVMWQYSEILGARIAAWGKLDIMADGLYRVVTPYLCAGFVVKDGRVVQCAPILRKKLSYWMTQARWLQT